MIALILSIQSDLSLNVKTKNSLADSEKDERAQGEEEEELRRSTAFLSGNWRKESDYFYLTSLMSQVLSLIFTPMFYVFFKIIVITILDPQ